MIELYGLNPKQMALADIMWSISDRDGVESFIATLPKSEARTCRVLIEMMQLAFLDEITDTQDACRVIDSIRK
jgi:hypothetical protein